MLKIHGHEVQGVDVDGQTRCGHYHSHLDVIAIKFPCCDTYFPCHLCHEATAGHPAKVWKRSESAQKAVLCGVCGSELTVEEYLGCDSHCPHCGAHFNPGCSTHYHLYFEV